MYIDRILHVRSSGSMMDFYASSYFSAEHVDLRLFAESRQLYAYCTYTETKPGSVPKKKRKVIDLTQFIKDNPDWDWTTLEVSEDYPCVENPLVPPSLIRINRTEQKRDPGWMNYFLGFYNGKTPKYLSPHQNTKCVDIETNIKVDSSGTKSLGVRFSFVPARHPVEPATTLPIVNGFACWPVHDVRTVTAVEGTQYFGDRVDRDRQCVLVDFGPVGGCTFFKCSECGGSLKEFFLPLDAQFDPENQTLLVVIDGRILLPDDYKVKGNAVTIDLNKLPVNMELDRLVCEGATIKNDTRLVEADGSRDLLNQTNSFVVIVNAKNMQLVQHATWFDLNEKEPDSKIVNTEDKLTFDQYARGLLYDRTTKSVHDYVREEQTTTFYAAAEADMVDWKVSIATVNHEKPLVILGGTRSNFMSAKAMMFDRPKAFCPDDSVLYPKFVLLDFIFRG